MLGESERELGRSQTMRTELNPYKRMTLLQLKTLRH